jgi:hypothetical protein
MGWERSRAPRDEFVRTLRTNERSSGRRPPQGSQARRRPRGTRGSPTRWRFRPPTSLTFRLGLAASPYCLRGRLQPSGAPWSAHTGTYGSRPGRARESRTKNALFAIFSFRSQAAAGRPRCNKGRRRRGDPDQRFADPVALSSTHLGDFPAGPCGHPRTAFAVSFDLAALRGRRTRESRDPRRGLQGDAARKSSLFAKNDVLTFPQLFQRSGDRSVDCANAVPSHAVSRRLARRGHPVPGEPLCGSRYLT